MTRISFDQLHALLGIIFMDLRRTIYHIARYKIPRRYIFKGSVNGISLSYLSGSQLSCGIKCIRPLGYQMSAKSFMMSHMQFFVICSRRIFVDRILWKHREACRHGNDKQESLALLMHWMAHMWRSENLQIGVKQRYTGFIASMYKVLFTVCIDFLIIALVDYRKRFIDIEVG